MHQPTVEGLEDYLAGKPQSARLVRFHNHLAGCQGCRDLVSALAEQSALLRELRAPESMDPTPGFYARVMDRIDAQSSLSLWSVFLEPVFGRRFLYAALSLLVALGTAVVSSNMSLRDMNDAVAYELEVSTTPGVDADHDRAVVFANLAAYSGSGVMEVIPASTSTN